MAGMLWHASRVTRSYRFVHFLSHRTWHLSRLLANLPEYYNPCKSRTIKPSTKPTWPNGRAHSGTGRALPVCRDIIDSPLVILNRRPCRHSWQPGNPLDAWVNFSTRSYRPFVRFTPHILRANFVFLTHPDPDRHQV